MDKVVALIRSASGTAEEADRAALWPALVEAAAEAAAALPDLTGLVVSRVVTPLTDGDPTLAIVEAWADRVDDVDLLERLLPPALRASNGLDVTAAHCTEIVFRAVTDYAQPGSAWSVKLAGTALRRDDFDPDAFFEYWTHTHAPIGGSVPGIGGYVVSRVHDGRLGEEAADALIEQWYENEQTFQDAQTGEAAQAAWADVANYAKTTGTAFWLLTEHVVVQPPATGPGTLEV